MVRYSREEKYTKPKNTKELLIIARERERGSFNFYEDMLKIVLDEDVKALIEDLKDAESGHIKMIEDKLKDF